MKIIAKILYRIATVLVVFANEDFIEVIMVTRTGEFSNFFDMITNEIDKFLLWFSAISINLDMFAI